MDKTLEQVRESAFAWFHTDMVFVPLEKISYLVFLLRPNENVPRTRSMFKLAKWIFAPIDTPLPVLRENNLCFAFCQMKTIFNVYRHDDVMFDFGYDEFENVIFFIRSNQITQQTCFENSIFLIFKIFNKGSKERISELEKIKNIF